MTNYWYIARPNELFIDTDNFSRSIKHTRARLQGAIECGKLNVVCVMQRPSASINHVHIIIKLKNSISSTERHVWEIILHSDIYRGCCNIMRSLHSIPSPDILISEWQTFFTMHPDNAQLIHRNHDDFCNCKTKHNAETMRSCPAAIRLRGKYRNAGFFGKPSKNPCKVWP